MDFICPSTHPTPIAEPEGLTTSPTFLKWNNFVSNNFLRYVWEGKVNVDSEVLMVSYRKPNVTEEFLEREK
jgi:hypothetical protein